MIFEEIAQVMDARPVKEIQRRTGLKAIPHRKVGAILPEVI